MARTKTLLPISLALLALAAWLLLPGLLAEEPTEPPQPDVSAVPSSADSPAGATGTESSPGTPGPFAAGAGQSVEGDGPANDSGIRGHIVDALDVPVRDARIRLLERLPEAATREARSDALGRFELKAPAGSGYALEVEHPEYAPLPLLRYLELPAGASLDVGQLRLQSGLTLRGRVVLPGGAGLPGALLVLRPSLAIVDGPFAPEPRRMRSDSVGRFAFHGLTDQRYDLEVAPPPPWAQQRRSGIVATGPALTVALTRGHRLRGQVRGPGGQPRAGAQLRILVGDRQPPRELLSDAEGRFDVEGLLAGPCRVIARAHGAGLALERELSLPHPAPLQLQLLAGTELRLHLMTGNGRKLPKTARLLLRQPGEREPVALGPLPLQAALLTTRGLGPGDWRGELRVEGFAPAEFELPLRGEPFVERRLPLDVGATLRGRVLGTDGEPVARLRLALRRPLPGGRRRLRVRRETLAAATSGADGRFELRGLAEGPIELLGALGRSPQQLLLEMELSGAKTREVTLRWPPGRGRLRVTLALDVPLPSLVLLRPVRGGPALRHRFVQRREHEWRGLVPGGYMVQRVGSEKAPELAQVSGERLVSIDLR